MQQPCGFVPLVLTSLQYKSLALRPRFGIVSGVLVFYIVPGILYLKGKKLQLNWLPSTARALFWIKGNTS